MSKEVIEEIQAVQVLDSRGRPTVWVSVVGSRGSRGEAMVPSGASCGSKEAVELRDGGGKFLGFGVRKAIAHIEDFLKPQLLGVELGDQALIDQILVEVDGTENFSRMGANAVLPISMAAARAGAQSCSLPLYRYLGGIDARSLPMPMFNLLNGGMHAENLLEIQEFMIRPIGAANFTQALDWGVKVSWELKNILKEKSLSCGYGDEGGFAPDLENDRLALELLVEAVVRSELELGKDIAFALDVAATSFLEKGQYVDIKRRSHGGDFASRSPSEQIHYLGALCNDFPIDSLEDGLAEQDWEGWVSLTNALGDKVQVVGDDLLVTNCGLLRKAGAMGAANSILIKPNQIGTVTKTLEVINLAKRIGYSTVISHRSGETEDTFISDLCVATGAGQIKAGALARSERCAKYNRLLLIEQELGECARFEDGNPVRFA